MPWSFPAKSLALMKFTVNELDLTCAPRSVCEVKRKKIHVSKTDLFTDCTKAVDLIVKGMEGAINSKSVIYDF